MFLILLPFVAVGILVYVMIFLHRRSRGGLPRSTRDEKEECAEEYDETFPLTDADLIIETRDNNLGTML